MIAFYCGYCFGFVCACCVAFRLVEKMRAEQKQVRAEIEYLRGLVRMYEIESEDVVELERMWSL